MEFSICSNVVASFRAELSENMSENPSLPFPVSYIIVIFIVILKFTTFYW